MATTAPTINGKTFAQASAGITDRKALGNLATQYQNVGSTSSTPNVPAPTYNSGNTRNGVPIPDRVSNAAGTASYLYGSPDATKISQSIATSDLGKNTPTIPTTPTDNTNYNAMTSGLAPAPTISTAADASLKANQDNFRTMLKSLQAPPSQVDAYKQAQNETGILGKQQAVNDLSAQLNQIQSDSQANQLRVTGQGRGIPEAIIGGQQSQIAKEAAIAALPVSAQLQAAQGNLATAEQNLNTLFSIKSADATAQYEYKNNLVKSVYDFASGQEKIKLDYAMKQEDRAYAAQQANQDSIKQLTLEAVKAGAPASVISKIAAVDMTDKNAFNSATALAAPYLAAGNNEIVKVGDNTMIVNKATGKVVKNFGSGSTGSGNGSSTSTVVRTVATPSGQKPVTGYTLSAGDDPYFIAKQNGIDMAALAKLNPTITDWTKLPVGAVINLPNTADAWLTGRSADQIASYNGLPDDEKATIKQLVNGDALLTDIVKSRGKDTQGQIQKLINEATKIDPNFSINANKQRFAYQQQYNNPNGKEQLQINAINTGLGHLAEFKTASDALGNTIALPYNKLVNYLNKNVGDPRVANLNTVITALAGELAAVYKGGTAPTDQETEEWRKTILASYSKGQTAGVTSTTANLISNKMLALNNSYKNVMGAYPDSQIINNDVLQQLNDSGVNVTGITSKLTDQGYTPPTAKTLKAYYNDPKYTSMITNAISQFPQYNESEILQVLGLSQ